MIMEHISKWIAFEMLIIGFICGISRFFLYYAGVSDENYIMLIFRFLNSVCIPASVFFSMVLSIRKKQMELINIVTYLIGTLWLWLYMAVSSI